MSEQSEKWFERAEESQTALLGYIMTMGLGGSAFLVALLDKVTVPFDTSHKVAFWVAAGGFGGAVYLGVFTLGARYERHRLKMRSVEARESKNTDLLKKLSDSVKGIDNRLILYFYSQLVAVGFGISGLIAYVGFKYSRFIFSY